MNPQAQIIIMAACLLMSASFSATETAFSTMSKTKLKTKIEKGNKRAALALKLSEKYDRLLSTILIGNNLVNILLSSIATVFVITLCVRSKDQAFADSYGTLISTAAVTLVVLMFGEITPKSIAKNRPEGFAMFSAPLMQLLVWILIPFSGIFSLWTKLVAKIFRVKADNKILATSFVHREKIPLKGLRIHTRNCMRGAENMAKPSGRFLAMDLGVISPNISTTKVTAPVAIRVP